MKYVIIGNLIGVGLGILSGTLLSWFFKLDLVAAFMLSMATTYGCVALGDTLGTRYAKNVGKR